MMDVIAEITLLLIVPIWLFTIVRRILADDPAGSSKHEQRFVDPVGRQSASFLGAARLWDPRDKASEKPRASLMYGRERNRRPVARSNPDPNAFREFDGLYQKGHSEASR